MLTDKKIEAMKYLTEVANWSRGEFNERMMCMHSIAKLVDDDFVTPMFGSSQAHGHSEQHDKCTQTDESKQHSLCN